MSLQTLNTVQSPLYSQPFTVSSAIPSNAPCVENYPVSDDVIIDQLVSFDLSGEFAWRQEEALSRLEQEEELKRTTIHSDEAHSFPEDASLLERLEFRVRHWRDKISAAIYRNTQVVVEEDEDICPELGSNPQGEGDSRHSEPPPWDWTESKQKAADGDDDEKYLNDAGYEGKQSPEDWKNDNRTMSEIPEYVLDYAPLVYLFSGEHFWPCDIAEHLDHVTPNLNYTPILSRTNNLNLTNLDDLNEYDNGRFVYLKSDDNVEERPDWLGGQKNIPDEPEDSFRAHHPHGRPLQTTNQDPPQGGRSSAPAVLITVNKGHGIVDAFWFYFYSYNLGNVVLNIRFGNHVGDWEHSLIRFQHGKPKIVFFSEHYFGQAYSYDAVEKIGQRPVVYSAVGTHAMYATPGLHPYILPLGLLHDETDKGPLWDPAMNAMKYTYNVRNDTLTPDRHTSDAPMEWFFFNGHWGDKLYPLDDGRQYTFAGQYHYVTGPLGPRFKHLGRRKVCQGPYTNKCVVKQWLDAEGDREIPIYPGPGEGAGEEGDIEDRY